ncbi:hypothetical protein IAT38_006639 [Cryptococcus sp. DSM 104549]
MLPSVALSLLATAALTAPALAFQGTSPLLVWSSEAGQQLQEALGNSAMKPADEVYGKLSSLGCDWDTVVVMHVDQLHHSHVPHVGIPQDAHVHVPYLTRPSRRSLDSSLEAWAASCGAQVVEGLEGLEDGEGEKVVAKVDVAEGAAIPAISRHLSPNSILLITGSGSSHPSKRQERPFPTHTTSRHTSTAAITATATASRLPGRPQHNSTIPPSTAPLLDRVQILTTPIITALLITFGLFVPLAAFGISALAGIQVPPRMMEIGKGLTVGKDRKDQ